VFAVNIDGTGFTNLHYFARGAYNSFGYYTNSDGIYPQAGLMLSGNTLYGTAEGGGSSGVGAVFAVNIDGTGFTNLYSFTAATNTGPPYYFSTNNDGAYPQATPCMGRRLKAAVRATARCSPSTPMARVLQTCILSPVMTATDSIRKPD
jgi:uncharacterized repeat protein (TIGR03803 family)